MGKGKKKSDRSACIKNVKDSKQLQHYVKEALESESFSNDSDADEDNAILEEYESK